MTIGSAANTLEGVERVVKAEVRTVHVLIGKYFVASASPKCCISGWYIICISQAVLRDSMMNR